LIGAQCQYCGVVSYTVDISIILGGSQNARNACSVTIVVAKRSIGTCYIPRLRMDSARKLMAILVNP
jgi:hypothetical protein